jgi:hypothetical protein
MTPRQRIGLFALSAAAAVLALRAAAVAGPQYKPGEVAQRPAWERYLETADIVRSERLGEGVTNPWKITLENSGGEKKAVWKGTTGLQEWRFEIAAYRLDKLLGLNMLPPAVEREFNRDRGAMILWADSKTSLFKLVDDNEKARKAGRQEDPPTEFLDLVGQGKYATRIWDCLIANEDRTQENILYTEDWRTLLIDHSFAFRSEGEYAQKLVYGRNGIKKHENGDPLLINQAPRALVDRIRTLDAASIKKAVGPYLTAKEIAAIISRAKILVAEIEEMAKQIGEAKFYF